MGENKRYPYLTPQRAEERELKQAHEQGPLQTLTPTQLRLDVRVISIVPARTPLWALAWLRFGTTDVRTTVQVKRWTDDAVGVEVDIDGEKVRCWIWQGACQRLAAREDAWR